MTKFETTRGEVNGQVVRVIENDGDDWARWVYVVSVDDGYLVLENYSISAGFRVVLDTNSLAWANETADRVHRVYHTQFA